MATVPSEDLASLLSEGTTMVFEPGDVLIRQGDDQDTDVFVVLSGVAKIVGTTATGDSVLITVRTSGDLLGEFAAIDRQPRSATVVAATRMSVRRLGGDVFLSFMSEHEGTNHALRVYITRKIRATTQHRIDVSGASSVLIGIARVLERLFTEYGRAGTADVVHLDVALTQSELAALVGASEPSVHRALAELRRSGIIATGWRSLTVRDISRLTAIAGTHS